MRNDRERLADVLEAIERIEQQAVKGREAFESEELIQVWIIHHLEIIGEAVRALSSDVTQHPAIEWPKIVGMRNILVHNYFDIDLDIVWAVVESDLPELKSRISEILGAPH
jgi:uncharacterized protein with HEPN domain